MLINVLTILFLCSTDFVVTGSVDGHVKFWKKQDEGVEFVKHFRCHLGNIQGLCTNHTGSLLCSVSNDKSIKVFDVINFGKVLTTFASVLGLYRFMSKILNVDFICSDMINMIKSDYTPLTCEWIHRSGDAVQALAV